MIVAWLQTCSSTGTACSGSSPWKVANWHAGAAANRVRGDLDRRVILVDRGGV